MRALAIATVVVVVTTAGTVAAKPAGYEKQYDAALQMENSGDLVGALAGFEAIPREKRDWATRLHIASVKAKLGRLLAAAKDYDEIRNDPAMSAATVETASTDYDAVVARTPKLLLELAPATSGVDVFVDGDVVVVPATKLVDPGAHSVVAKRGGKAVWQRDLNVAEGTSVNVLIDAPAPAVPAATNATMIDATVPSVPLDSGAYSSQRTIGYVTLAAGSVLALGAGGAWLLGNAAKSEYDASCGPHTCDEGKKAEVRRWDVIAVASGGLALAAMGTGIALIVTAPRPATTLKPSVGWMNGFVLEGRF